ncbi:MAG: hypothetical protein RL685_4266 [Pseudomonadota bacterium]|jgi:hypothetical protein
MQSGTPLPDADVLILEIYSDLFVDPRGRIHVRREDLREPEDYEPRLAALQRKGCPWINVTCYGLWDRRLIVGVEFPKANQRPSSSTSLNYSSAPCLVLEHGFSADVVLLVE